MFNKFFKKEKKNCLSCAFCCKEKELKERRTLSYLNNSVTQKSSLTDSERNKLKNDDYDFLFEENHQFKKWENEIKSLKKEKAEKERQKRLEEKKIMGTLGVVAELSSIIPVIQSCTVSAYSPPSYDDFVEESKEFGIEPPPKNEVLSCSLYCWQERWDEGKQPELIEKRKELKGNKCEFYYPYSLKDNKSLKACEKEREEQLKSKISIKNSIIIPAVIGLIVALIGGIGVYQYQKWDEKQIIKNQTITKSKATQNKQPQSKKSKGAIK